MNKRRAWVLILLALGTLYYLSSIPGLRVLPVLKQVNYLLTLLDTNMQKLSLYIAANLPSELGPAKTFSSDFYHYASENPVIIEFILRKAAHVGVFFLITILFFLLLREYIERPGLTVLGAFALGSLVAALDEFHQSFVDGRHGTLVDVFINLIGVSMAAVLILFSFFLASKWLE